MTLPDDQRRVLAVLCYDVERYICRHRGGYRLCNSTGEFTGYVPSATLRAMVTGGLLIGYPYSPDPRLDTALSWWITDRGFSAGGTHLDFLRNF